MLLKDLETWQGWKESRVVDITIRHNRSTGKDETTFWVYDGELGIGQFVKSLSDIDLEGIKEAKDREYLGELKAKYERGSVNAD
jgi:hypothetical protein